MDKQLKDAIMALPQMKERIKLLQAFADQKFKILPENLSVSIRLTTKTIANKKEDETSIEVNNKMRELISNPLPKD